MQRGVHDIDRVSGSVVTVSRIDRFSAVSRFYREYRKVIAVMWRDMREKRGEEQSKAVSPASLSQRARRRQRSTAAHFRLAFFHYLDEDQALTS